MIAELRRQGDNLRLFFPFAAPTPAAVFQRADTLWLVFDTKAVLDVGVLGNDQSKTIRSAAVSREDDAQVVRLKLERPRLTSVEPQDFGWLITVGEAMAGATKPLIVARNIVSPGRTSITIPFDEPQKAHWLSDADGGDKLLVVTGLGPTRGLIKSHDFVDSPCACVVPGHRRAAHCRRSQGGACGRQVILMRPGGLTLSDAAVPQEQQKAARALTFDTGRWSLDRDADYTQRQFDLVRAAAEAPPTGRTASRLELSRFYLRGRCTPRPRPCSTRRSPTSVRPLTIRRRSCSAPSPTSCSAASSRAEGPRQSRRRQSERRAAVARAGARRLGKWPEARDAFRGIEGALGARCHRYASNCRGWR